MKKIIPLTLIGVGLILSACSVSETELKQNINQDTNNVSADYTCPTEKSYDCQPMVSPANQKYCASAYRQWATKNCNTLFLD